MIRPKAVDVKPQQDFCLLVTFNNNEKRMFDVKPYLEYEMFKPLRDIAFFNSVRPAHGTIQWANEADFCPDTVYLNSVKM